MKNISMLILYVVFVVLINSNSTIAAEIEILSDFPGEGPIIENHSKISVHYRGYLEDGTEFDNSFRRNQPFTFQMGLRQVIPGWEIGLMNMKVGGKRRIKIPSELAYGKKGAGQLIPPNADLIFEIEIVTIQPPGYKILNSDQLKSMQEEGLIVIDIRTKKEHKNTGTIKGSSKITAFDKKGNFNISFIDSYQLIANSTSKVVFVSDKGDISAILANGFVEQLGYKNIFSLKGGIQEWMAQGNATNK